MGVYDGYKKQCSAVCSPAIPFVCPFTKSTLSLFTPRLLFRLLILCRAFFSRIDVFIIAFELVTTDDFSSVTTHPLKCVMAPPLSIVSSLTSAGPSVHSRRTSPCSHPVFTVISLRRPSSRSSLPFSYSTILVFCIPFSVEGLFSVSSMDPLPGCST